MEILIAYFLDALAKSSFDCLFAISKGVSLILTQTVFANYVWQIVRCKEKARLGKIKQSFFY